MSDSPTIYQYNDDLLFTVTNPPMLNVIGGNDERTVDFYCPKHRVKLTDIGRGRRAPEGYKLVCPICQRDSDYVCAASSSSHTLDSLKERALALHDKDLYQDAKLVRLDDYYVPEIKKFDALPDSTNYSIKADVKTDKDGDTIVVLYVGHKGEKDKSQIFIKPEKLQLSNDHKDLDPAKVLAKIELTLKDRNITQDYRNDNA